MESTKNPKMKSNVVHLTGLLAALCITQVMAMEAAAPVSEDQRQEIEEITVTGQRTLMSPRLEASEAEDVMFGLYNELNTDEKYDIVCRADTRIFSHIREKSCRPEYAWTAMMDEAQNRARGEEQGVPVAIVLADQYPRLNAKFQEMLQKSPELFSAFAKHYELKEQLRLRRKTYFGKDE